MSPGYATVSSRQPQVARHRAAATARLLRSEQASPHALTNALESACGYDGLSWGQTQSDEDASAILDLIDHAGWDDYTVQQIAAGIAT